MTLTNKIFNSLLFAIVVFAILMFFWGEAMAFLGGIFAFFAGFVTFMILDIVQNNIKKKIGYYIVIAILIWGIISGVVYGIITRIAKTGLVNYTLFYIAVAIGLVLSCVITYSIYKKYDPKIED